MAKFMQKEEAIKMRKSGMSIGSIARNLVVSKSSVSAWCEGIILTKVQIERLHKNMVDGGLQGRAAGAKVNKEKRLLMLEGASSEASNLVQKLSERDRQMISLGLYWGEGSKNNERKFVFTNSDPVSIRSVIEWVVSLGTKREDVVASVYINESHQDRIKKVESFWKNELLLSSTQFRRTILVKVPMKKVYSNRETYFGVLRLTVKKSSYLKALIMASLSNVKNQI
jgi:hypothetical protein